MDARMTDVRVTDAPERSRYEARIGEDVVGYTDYRRNDGTIMLAVTEVREEYRCSGIGTALARTSLEEARSHGRRVEPVDPFIAGWIERHPQYADLLADECPRLGEDA
jgi:predicted GNAT family acetyltransferase